MQQLLKQITNIQSVVVSTSFKTDQSALLQLLHQAAQSLASQSLISLELIAPEKSSLGISVVRELQEQLRYAATAQRPRWIALLKAETLTVPAQNALLKLLEEPPVYTYLFLVTNYPSRLLPTITSRTLVVSESEIGDALAVSLPELSNEGDSTLSYRELCNSTIAQACERAEEFGDKEQASNFVQTLLLEVHSNLQQSVQNDTAKKTFGKPLQDAKSCLLAQKYLEANCNCKLVMGELFLTITQ